MTDQTAIVPPLDSHAAMRWQALADRQTLKSDVPWLHQEVGQRMVQRLGWIKRQPKRWIHWRPASSGTQVHAGICALYPQAQVQLAPPNRDTAQLAKRFMPRGGWVRGFIAQVQGQTARMLQPVQEGSAHMLWSNMSLHTEPDPQGTMAQWHSMMAVDGYLMFSCLGPDTVQELRQIYDAFGWGPAAHPLIDMHDWGDMLVASGFAEPVMDMERIVLSFATPQRALQELRGLGRNLHPGRFQGLRGRAWLEQMLRSLDAQRKAGGNIELTFEVIYGHAFKPPPRMKVAAESAISMRDMRTMLGQASR